MTLTLTSSPRVALYTTARPVAATRPHAKGFGRRSLVVRADKDPEQAAKDAGKNIQEGISGAINKGEDKLKNLSDRAGDVVDDASSDGRRQADKAEGSARDVAGKAEKEGKSFGDTIKNSIKGGLDAISGKAKDAKKNID